MNCWAMRSMFERARPAATLGPSPGTPSARCRPARTGHGAESAVISISRWRRTSSSPRVAGKTSTKRNRAVLNDGCFMAQPSRRSDQNDMAYTDARSWPPAPASRVANLVTS
jgi:hypothetical protein